jgi:long-subunit fatty acid transport protein
VIVALVLAAPSWAGETAAFLKVGAGARAIAMGGAYTAIADDINAITWNPAGLSSLTRSELGATHAQLAAGARYDFIGFGQATRYGTLGLAGTYLSQGAIEGRDAGGLPTGGYKASDQAVNIAFAPRPLGGCRLGANVKYIKSGIANDSTQGYAVDFGGQYSLAALPGPGVPRLGLAVQNLGPGMKFLDQTSQLPLTLAVGLGYRLPVGLALAADFKHRPYSRDSQFGLGTEYALLANFALRAGYGTAKTGTGASQGTFSALGGFATGLGFKLRNYSLDYSFTPAGELGNTQRLSLAARW